MSLKLKNMFVVIFISSLGFIALAIALCIFRNGNSDLSFEDDSNLMKEKVLRVVPKGTAVSDAKMIMEHHGFKCSIEATTETPGRVLYCDRKEGWPIVRRTQVVFIIGSETDAIDGAEVTTGLIGP